MSKSDILRLFISNAYTLEKQWFFSLTLNECPASKIYIYLKVGHTGMNGEGEKSSFSWFTPPVAITARAGHAASSNQKLQLGLSNKCRESRTCVCEEGVFHCFSQPYYGCWIDVEQLSLESAPIQVLQVAA